MSWIRAIVAVGLSLLVPGAGHVVIRDWGRAVLFGALFVISVVLLLPVEQLWAIAGDGSMTSAGSMGETMTELSETVDSETDTIDRFTLLFLSLFAAIHAGTQAFGLTDTPGADEDVAACPTCGKPLDEELSFCHWCTTRLDDGDQVSS
ncbi:hypothetical protein C479_12863 [Halovivax asiaticus JCM 14624]|uniref:DUF7575 domain-containing protein n=1 Tax=Halovivax asiaticus JCM 14624 TaxID=1227490 RepID=M0BCM8_9EURY|nr:zinc ribbon domain-containing protein [Halovivax asiaticus]ELZ08232.1 hypothetical protein C479_12863 [Halovivax asiaticus JCM 14624]